VAVPTDAQKAARPYVQDAERRAAAVAGQTNAGTGAAAVALADFAEWVLGAREALAKWSVDHKGPPPVTLDEFSARQREAVRRGADARIVGQLTLAEPKGLVELEAERRLIRSVLGDAGAPA